MEDERGEAGTTEANRRRFKKDEHSRTLTFAEHGAGKHNYLICFFVQLLFSGVTDRRSS